MIRNLDAIFHSYRILGLQEYQCVTSYCRAFRFLFFLERSPMPVSPSLRSMSNESNDRPFMMAQ